MAWLKGLAGKAEDFLNQIDQNAAVALQKDKKDFNTNEPLLTEVTWDGQLPNRDIPSRPPRFTSPLSRPAVNGTGIGPVRSSPNLALHSPVKTPKPNSDDELIKFLNSTEVPASAEEKPVREGVEVTGNGNAVTENRKFSPVIVEPENEQKVQHSSQSSSRRGSPIEVPVVQSRSALNVPAVAPTCNDAAAELRTENSMLKNELRSLNNEMSLLLQRTKSAEKENWSLQQQVSSLQTSQQQTMQSLQEREDQMTRLEKELHDMRQQTVAAQDLAQGLQLENARLVQDSLDSSGHQSQALQALQDRVLEREEELDALQNAHKQEIKSLQDKLASLESEGAGLASQLKDMQQQMNQSEAASRNLQQQWERARAELSESRSELDQYRARAQRILQDKERLISELKGQGSTEQNSPVDDTVELELEQLRQERELLREEVAQVSARLKASRDELQETERRLESGREQASQSLQLLQDSLQEERKKRQAAEEDCRSHAEELRSVRDELSRQRAQLASRVREREAELTRLRSQLSQRPASPNGEELESRLHALTQTLVQKQSSLETVTTEKNALRLQLEKMEHKHRETLAILHQMQSGIGSVNDTDDAKARVPSFLMESPFDTGVTRRVKRAYSSLDAVSIRTGVFLRRYPLARILVLCYMVMLHLWVMLVLLSYTPSANA